MTANGDRPRVALYLRVSTDEQALSLDGQLRELREHAETRGLEVVGEVSDKGEKRRDPDRPGIERLRDLCSEQRVDEILAWSWDRFGEFPVPEMLAIEFEDFGTVLRSLDDGGEGEDSYELRAIKSLFSRREGRTRVRRSKRGMADKALRGEVFGGFRARFGFRFVKAANGKNREVNVGYEVDPEKMATVRRIFEMAADGASLHRIADELEQGGVPNPSGGPRWSRTTIKNAILDDIYRPHGFEEIAALVPSRVAATLDPEKVYGIHWSGRKRSKFASSKGKARTVYETPREEWIGVPVPLDGSGLNRATVERARARIESNKATSKAGDQVWELSGGVLRCAECGRSMIAYRRARRSGGHWHYYRCRPNSKLDVCANRKSHPAEALAYEAAKMFETYASRGTLLELYDRAIAERQGDRGRRANLKRITMLGERLGVLAKMRRGFQDQQAEGLMTLPELRERLAELEEEKAAISAELSAAEDEAASARRIEAARESLARVAWYDPVHAEWEQDVDAVRPNEFLTLAASAEETHRAYRRYGARFEVDRDGTLTLHIEVDLGAEARCDSSQHSAQRAARLG